MANDEGKVLQFAPTAQALENIPHMLRYWADMVERDQKDGRKFEIAALILAEHGDARPAFFTAGSPHGDPHHPLYVAGVFDYCRAQMLSVCDREAE